jgi:hypothetical protein
MNSRVATNHNNHGKLYSPAEGGNVIMLLIEYWIPDWGYSEADVDATWASFRLLIDFNANRERLAWRHNYRANYLNKDGSVFDTGQGTTGFGAEPVWFRSTVSPYPYWRDGYK